MPRATSVIVRVERPGGWLTRLLASLDAQTLAAADFEVIIEPTDPGAPIAARMHELAGRRPNVRVVDPGTAEAAAEGEWILDLGDGLDVTRPTLPADALEHLVAFAAEAASDVVLSRVAERAGGLVRGMFAPPLDGPAPEFDPRDPTLAVFRRAGAGADPVVGVDTGQPALLVEELPAPAAVTVVSPAASTLTWIDGLLIVRVEGSVDAAPPAARVLVSVRERGSGREFWLPTETEGPVSDRFAATAELDVRIAGLGSALAEAVWELRVGVHGDASSWGRRAAVPPAAAPPGLVDGILVVPGRDEGAATVDIGARRRSAIGAIDAADVSFAESARGTLMTARLPRIAVAGPARLSGLVLLGDFPLPSFLVAESGAARIESYVSGLAGASALGTRFGGGKAAATGLTLRISPVGAMDVAPTPPATKGAAAKGTPAPGAAAKLAAPASTVARLRRRVPARLEPAVRKLAATELGRRAYRRLNRR